MENLQTNSLHHIQYLRLFLLIFYMFFEDFSSDLFDNLQNCKNFVQNMLNDVSWKPDKIFAVDVGLSYGNVPRLIELNSFSCSGWYSSNCEKIIEAANSLAEIEYKGLF